MTGAAPLAFLFATLGAVLAQEPAGDEGYLRWAVERLDSPEGEVRENAFQSLLKEGPAAVPRAIEGFDAASPRARRLRARLVRRAGGAEALDPVRARLLDPDPEVRGEWAGYLGRVDLPRASVPGRASDLARLARDAAPEVSRTALEGLTRLDHPSSARELASLARSSEPRLRRDAASALGSIPSGRTHLLELALDLEAKDPLLFAQLLPLLGAALASLEGKEAGRDPEPALRLFARHWADADPVVRWAARAGFLGWVGGLNALRKHGRAATLLERMVGMGGEAPSLLERVVVEHLFWTRDEAAAARWIGRLEL